MGSIALSTFMMFVPQHVVFLFLSEAYLQLYTFSYKCHDLIVLSD